VSMCGGVGVWRVGCLGVRVAVGLWAMCWGWSGCVMCADCEWGAWVCVLQYGLGAVLLV
jgi:hypothetical protein